MNPKSLFRAACASALSLAAVSTAHASCGAAFCSLNTDWALQAAAPLEGSVLDVRYEHIRQNQPRSGSERVGVGAIRRHHDEVHTDNRNLLLNYSHSFASGWGLAVSVPLADRDHLHIHNHHGAQLTEQWNFRELGDVRVTGRYQTPIGNPEGGLRMAGVIAGLKLPTGRTSLTNDDGDAAERSLQPGSGTTDAILGAFYRQHLPAYDLSWFAQVQYQQALNRHDDYAPGGQLSADIGLSRQLSQRVAALLQLNAVVKRRDRGAQAEPQDSGSRALFLSPGIRYAVTDTWQVYGFYQQPLHQSVNGVQLTPRHAVSVGASWRF